MNNTPRRPTPSHLEGRTFLLRTESGAALKPHPSSRHNPRGVERGGKWIRDDYSISVYSLYLGALSQGRTSRKVDIRLAFYR